MIIGIGTDIVSVQRIKASCERNQSFAKRILVDAEYRQFEDDLQRNSQLAYQFLAKRFAAKEATAKALGTGIGRGVSFQHMEITHTGMGAPLLILSGGALLKVRQLSSAASAQLDNQLMDGAGFSTELSAEFRTHVSISDEQDYALAYVILEGL